jgi:hypothetical protein
MQSKEQRRIKQLETALRPFAKEADEWHESVKDRYCPGVTEPKQKYAYARACFSIGNCRRAARLLSQTSEG